MEPEPLAHVGTWLSVLPPVLAIVLAIYTRQVFISLFFGIWLGWTILADWDPLAGLASAIGECIAVFQDAGNTRVIIFSAMVGALIALNRASWPSAPPLKPITPAPVAW